MKCKQFKIFAAFAAVSILALGVAGCAKKKTAGQGSTASAGSSGGAATDVAGAKKIFTERCVVCHGDKGLGDGPGSKALKPKPRAFGDAKWQASVTDEQIKKTIISGGLAVGKSAIMPGNPDLKGKGKAAVLNGLVKLIRDFKK